MPSSTSAESTIPLWSDDLSKGALQWYIKVPDTIRLSLLAVGPGRAPAGSLRPVHLPTLVALHALLPHGAGAPGTGAAEVIIRPETLAQATGWAPATLYNWLHKGGTGHSTEGVLRPHAQLTRTYFEPDRAMLDDRDDTGLRWVIDVDTPAEGAWMQIPAWWLFARTHHTLVGGRIVERRLMRTLHRSPGTGEWETRGSGMDAQALLGAAMVTERLKFNAAVPQIHTWSAAVLGARWGVSPTTAHRALKAAEAAGFLAPSRRTGGRGRSAVRRLVLTPTDRPGQMLPVGWGEQKTTRHGVGADGLTPVLF